MSWTSALRFRLEHLDSLECWNAGKLHHAFRYQGTLPRFFVSACRGVRRISLLKTGVRLLAGGGSKAYVLQSSIA
jgi:hypothetical protein